MRDPRRFQNVAPPKVARSLSPDKLATTMIEPARKMAVRQPRSCSDCGFGTDVESR
jgi:hypothetical protein